MIAIVLDVWTKDESALTENYVDKKEFSKNIDVTDKSLLTNTILHTKEDILTARYFKKDYEIHGKQCEEDVIRHAYYNKFGQAINTDYGNFNALIHEEREEEVVSQFSVLGPNKDCNMFDPFTDKYRKNSLYRSGMSIPENSGNFMA